MSRRWIAIPMLALMVMLGGLLGACSSSNNDSGMGSGQSQVLNTVSMVRFHDEMRKLWEDHITWTRLTIVALAENSPNLQVTEQRLLENQTQIGNAIKSYYGSDAGDRLSALLKDHITIAGELLTAAKAGNGPAAADANARWYANANEIADFLAAANPDNWKQSDLREAMKMHLDQTLAEATAELQGQYQASVDKYEEVHAHILAMADIISGGIMEQFPEKFKN